MWDFHWDAAATIAASTYLTGPFLQLSWPGVRLLKVWLIKYKLYFSMYITLPSWAHCRATFFSRFHWSLWDTSYTTSLPRLQFKEIGKMIWNSCHSFIGSCRLSLFQGQQMLEETYFIKTTHKKQQKVVMEEGRMSKKKNTHTQGLLLANCICHCISFTSGGWIHFF